MNKPKSARISPSIRTNAAIAQPLDDKVDCFDDSPLDFGDSSDWPADPPVDFYGPSDAFAAPDYFDDAPASAVKHVPATPHPVTNPAAPPKRRRRPGHRSLVGRGGGLMLSPEIPAAMKAFREVARLVKGLRESQAVWVRLRQWPAIFWLAAHYDAAVTRGGILQQRRHAAYLAASLLPSGLIWASIMLGWRGVKTVDAVLARAQTCQAQGFSIVVPTGSNNALVEPMISPARSTRVPPEVLNDKCYRPDVIQLTCASVCVSCAGEIAEGAQALWRRRVGACHMSCPWPLEDPRA